MRERASTVALLLEIADEIAALAALAVAERRRSASDVVDIELQSAKEIFAHRLSEAEALALAADDPFAQVPGDVAAQVAAAPVGLGDAIVPIADLVRGSLREAGLDAPAALAGCAPEPSATASPQQTGRAGVARARRSKPAWNSVSTRPARATTQPSPICGFARRRPTNPGPSRR
ncbi:MAG: hypothetical protein ACREM2_03470 [Vulcanimicrobiaceae bacterium]